MGSPVMLTLYGENDEVKQTYSRSFIPWGMVKKAMRLKSIVKTGGKKKNDLTDEDYQAIGDLVIQFFGNKFTLEELEAGADFNEMLTVLQAILGQATQAANPTLPAGAGK